MHGYASFFIANADGSNQTIFTASTTAGVTTWTTGAIPAITADQMRGIASAINDALSQPLIGFVRTHYSTFGPPAIVFNPGNVSDPNDDTITFGGLPAWNRAKALAFVAAVAAYVP